jgi:hypothetical protein
MSFMWTDMMIRSYVSLTAAMVALFSVMVWATWRRRR